MREKYNVLKYTSKIIQKKIEVTRLNHKSSEICIVIKSFRSFLFVNHTSNSMIFHSRLKYIVNFFGSF